MQRFLHRYLRSLNKKIEGGGRQLPLPFSTDIKARKGDGMARKAKCRACGTELDTETAFKLIEHDTNDKEKRFYFCSRDEYLAHEEKKRKDLDNKNKFYQLFCDILGVSGITNTALWKEKAEINKVFSDENIIGYLEENKDWITNTVNKLDGNIYGKIRYVSTILKNSLEDFKPIVKADKNIPIMSEEHYETKFKPKIRVGLEDLEDECCV